MTGLPVLSVASEIYPLVKTGGLADVAGALPPALAAEGVPHRVQRAGNLLSVFFTVDEVVDYAGAQAAQTWRFPPFFHALLERRVYLPPSAYEAWFLSSAHDDRAVQTVLDALPAAAAAAAASRGAS